MEEFIDEIYEKIVKIWKSFYNSNNNDEDNTHIKEYKYEENYYDSNILNNDNTKFDDYYNWNEDDLEK